MKDSLTDKQLQKSYRENEDLFRFVLDNSLDILYKFNMELMKYEYINPAVYSVTGYTPEEIVAGGAEMIFSLMHPDDVKRYSKDIEELMAAEKDLKIPSYVQFRFKHKQKGYRWLCDTRSLICNGDNKPVAVVGILKDITEQKEIEEAFKKSKEQLKKNNLVKDKLFSIIGHDLNNSLGSIINLSKLMIENYPLYSDGEKLEIIKLINRSTSSTGIMLKNLLEWSMSERNLFDYNPKNLRLKIIVENCINALSVNSYEKQIEVLNDINDHVNVYCDDNMLASVIRNLLSNSIKYTRIGGIVRIGCRTEQNVVLVCISDNGIGIDSTTINRLFEMSKRKRRIGTAGEKGSGLGLLICKEFVEKNKGKIWVESTPGAGSKFYFTIPKNSLTFS